MHVEQPVPAATLEGGVVQHLCIRPGQDRGGRPLTSKHLNLTVDAAIAGAGIAGLWLANLLTGRGFSVAVCDGNAVGGQQTLASQGIVHGGGKYALDGRDWPLSRVLADMPGRWRACLAGEGEVDLRGVRVLSQRVAVHGPRGARRELDELVIDVPSLVHRLAEPVADRLLPWSVPADSIARTPEGVDHAECGDYAIRADTYVFAAGVGNQSLALRAGFDVPMRRRPLRQIVVRLPRPVAVFAHCVSGDAGDRPEMTVTSHGNALYVGGGVAEEYTGPDVHIRVVRGLLEKYFPALDLEGATFTAVGVERAEPAGVFPDADIREAADPLVARRGNCLLCWPIKMSLVPRLGDLVLARWRRREPLGEAWPGRPGSHPVLHRPPYANPSC